MPRFKRVVHIKDWEGLPSEEGMLGGGGGNGRLGNGAYGVLSELDS